MSSGLFEDISSKQFWFHGYLSDACKKKFFEIIKHTHFAFDSSRKRKTFDEKTKIGVVTIVNVVGGICFIKLTDRWNVSCICCLTICQLRKKATRKNFRFWWKEFFGFLSFFLFLLDTKRRAHATLKHLDFSARRRSLSFMLTVCWEFGAYFSFRARVITVLMNKIRGSQLGPPKGKFTLGARL